MPLLALDTTTEAGSCALRIGSDLLYRDCPIGRPHSESLLPLVAALLAEAGIGFADLRAIAFGAGPGSFTGLRVACGAAQGLAVVHDLPLLPVNSLAAMAWQCGGDKVLVALDARMGEVYSATFQLDDEGVTTLSAPVVCPPEQLALPTEAGWRACGNGLRAYPQLVERLTPWVTCSDAADIPHARAIAALAEPMLLAGQGVDAAAAVPFYVRDKVALTVAERLAQGGKA